MQGMSLGLLRVHGGRGLGVEKLIPPWLLVAGLCNVDCA